jgi:hypothetical protein
MERPLINIITRTHNQEEYFKICRKSIIDQTYPLINWIVGSDVPCNYYNDYVELQLPEIEYPQPQPSSYPAPWNKHCETLAEYCMNGWVIYLDSDDMFNCNDAVEIIVNSIRSDNDLMIWRVMITPDFIVPRIEDFGRTIQAGNISGIGIAFHTKHLPVKWSTWSYGDFRIIRELVMDKGLEPNFINKILTRTIDGPHNGK